MTRYCINCGNRANTTQHIMKKSTTDPVDYIRKPLCDYCHNRGPNSSNAISQRMINQISSIPSEQIVPVNGIDIKAMAGSISSQQQVVLPSGAISTDFVNLKTNKNNDFRTIRDGSAISVSGTQIDYVGYCFLVNTNSNLNL